MKIIFINGAPRSGKDSGGKYLWENMPEKRTVTAKFSNEIKTRTHAFYNLLDENMEPLEHDLFELCKDTPRAAFHGATPREAYTMISEAAKALHGNDYWGKILLKDLCTYTSQKVDNIAITDSGFKEEAIPIVEYFGAENCILLRLHRPGYGFENDSRSLIDLHEEGVTCYDIPSPDGDLEGLYRELRSRVPFLFKG